MRPLAICGIGIVIVSACGFLAVVPAAFAAASHSTIPFYPAIFISLIPFAAIGSVGILLPLAIARGAALNAYNIRGYLWDLVTMGKDGKVIVGDLVKRYAKPDWYVINKLQEWNRKGFFVDGKFVPTPVPSDESRLLAEFRFDSVRFPRNAAEAISGIGLGDRMTKPRSSDALPLV